MRFAAVDWSGRAVGDHRHIWTAVVDEGRLALDGGRDRRQVGDRLVELALADPGLVVGLDFGFSLPLWFLSARGLQSGLEVPSELAESWLRDCPPPFWGRRGRRRGPEPQFRLTELAARAAKSVFQLAGAGSVGTGSLRGFPLLRRLRAEGFALWPFDRPRLPLALEIFPRLLTGPVRKSRLEERRSYLRDRAWPEAAAVSEDAFDAAVSALRMHAFADLLLELPAERDPVYRREGRIWSPPPGA